MPEGGRCVQCGICSFSCPIGIDVRRHAWRGLPVKDSYCLTCHPTGMEEEGEGD